jgi:hypothetical protein
MVVVNFETPFWRVLIMLYPEGATATYEKNLTEVKEPDDEHEEMRICCT